MTLVAEYETNLVDNLDNEKEHIVLQCKQEKITNEDLTCNKQISVEEMDDMAMSWRDDDENKDDDSGKINFCLFLVRSDTIKFLTRHNL